MPKWYVLTLKSANSSLRQCVKACFGYSVKRRSKKWTPNKKKWRFSNICDFQSYRVALWISPCDCVDWSNQHDDMKQQCLGPLKCCRRTESITQSAILSNTQLWQAMCHKKYILYAPYLVAFITPKVLLLNDQEKGWPGITSLSTTPVKPITNQCQL